MDSSLHQQFTGKTYLMVVYLYVQLCSVWGPVCNFQSRCLASVIASVSSLSYVSLCSMNVKLL